MSFLDDIERAQTALSALKCSPYADKLGQVLQYKIFGLTTAIELAVKCFDLGVQVSKAQAVDRIVVEKNSSQTQNLCLEESQKFCPNLSFNNKKQTNITQFTNSQSSDEKRSPFDDQKMLSLNLQQNNDTWKQIKNSKRFKKSIVKSEPLTKSPETLSTYNRFAILDGLNEQAQKSVAQDYFEDKASMVEDSINSSYDDGSVYGNFLEQLNKM